MPKFFVTSDIHGYFDIFIKELTSAGFDKNDENHWLIVCGDCFDRGQQPRELKDYLDTVERKIIIRGNHEDLLKDMLKRCIYYNADISNGTVSTVKAMANEWDFHMAVTKASKELNIFINSTIDYFETENYVFVHSFFPFDTPNWRTEASKKDWEEARWGNPFTLSLATDLSKELNGKTLVFGHWHTSWAREHIDGIESEYPEDKNYLPYYGKNFIGLDACTPLSKRVNVIVLEDDFMEKSNV